jgi:hypothetical protein
LLVQRHNILGHFTPNPKEPTTCPNFSVSS